MREEEPETDEPSPVGGGGGRTDPGLARESAVYSYRALDSCHEDVGMRDGDDGEGRAAGSPCTDSYCPPRYSGYTRKGRRPLNQVGRTEG